MSADDVERNFARWRTAHEAGDKAAPIVAVKLAWYFRVPVPDWALQAIAEGFRKWTAGETRTIDEALGVERPKRWRVSKGPPIASGVYMEAKKRMPGEPYSEELFAEVAEHWGIGATTASEMYRGYKRELDAWRGTEVKPHKVKSRKVK